jgi:hypothetical protein
MKRLFQIMQVVLLRWEQAGNDSEMGTAPYARLQVLWMKGGVAWIAWERSTPIFPNPLAQSECFYRSRRAARWAAKCWLIRVIWAL